ncbi:hypothetical protein STRTUCAR8_00992 [Streptomyces turgidiscabies Car8]|uniref:Uncharacterized protein n=1 Tax=Streptomyces turgidiscabies (strain Car8) TaxID=698760 RepID=L7ET33_STRT8|nr:hypothetical protein STRTUCAR8_00992 [Streptomyces turgidiscabies Car8]
MNVTSAIFATDMPRADSSTIWARRQVTTDPVPPRMIAAGSGPRRHLSHARAPVRPCAHPGRQVSIADHRLARHAPSGGAGRR